mmetsp:Transcript_46593/g.135699  ORF Transcript_46593/g.135699 Transcript_46593/m.135699 type:complete len:306 (+) Transcript_46593:675-1592(+)
MPLALDGEAGKGVEDPRELPHCLHRRPWHHLGVGLELDIPAQRLGQKIVQHILLLVAWEAVDAGDRHLARLKVLGPRGAHMEAGPGTERAAHAEATHLVRGALEANGGADGLCPGLRQLALALVVVFRLALGMAFDDDHDVGEGPEDASERPHDAELPSGHIVGVRLEVDAPLRDFREQALQDPPPLGVGQPGEVRNLHVPMGILREHPHAHADSLRAAMADARDLVRNAGGLQRRRQRFRPCLGQPHLAVVVIRRVALGMPLTTDGPRRKGLKDPTHLANRVVGRALDECRLVRLECDAVQRLL